MRCGSRARLEGDNSKLVFDPVFNGKPVERLECRSDVVSDASAGDDPGQSILDTLHTGYILLGSAVEDEIGVSLNLRLTKLFL